MDLLGRRARETLFLKLEVDMDLLKERQGNGGVLLRNITRGLPSDSSRVLWALGAVMRTMLPKAIYPNFVLQKVYSRRKESGQNFMVSLYMCWYDGKYF